MQKTDVIIIGSGPAGCTAAIYVARNNYNVIMFTGEIKKGGQLINTEIVENYLGYKSIGGYELVQKFFEHINEYPNIKLIDETVIKVNFNTLPYNVKTVNTEVEAHSIIIATGARARLPTFYNFDKFWNKGISTCATCDGPLYKNKIVCVIGGGDHAFESSLLLSRYCPKVYVIIRNQRVRAQKLFQSKVAKKSNITIIKDAKVVEVFGKTYLENIKVQFKNKEKQILPCQGIFVAIGHIPETEIFKSHLELDKEGYIITKGTTNTSKEGIFAAGDVSDKRYRQAITAAGMGCQAAMNANNFLNGIQPKENKEGIFKLKFNLLGKIIEFSVHNGNEGEINLS